MAISKTNLLLHPIRLRIMTTLPNQRMTASDLSKALPDVPLATLYRQINALVEGGLLQVVDEKPVRGTVERIYSVSSPPSLTSEDLRSMTRRDYENAFSLFLSVLMGDVQRYLKDKPEKGEIDILADGVTLSKAQLLLSDEEFTEMNADIVNLLMSAAKNLPAPNRRRRVFTYLFLPVEG